MLTAVLILSVINVILGAIGVYQRHASLTEMRKNNGYGDAQEQRRGELIA